LVRVDSRLRRRRIATAVCHRELPRELVVIVVVHSSGFGFRSEPPIQNLDFCSMKAFDVADERTSR